MHNMKIHLVVVAFCTLMQTYPAVASTVEENRRSPLDWQDESVQAALTHPLVNLMKRSKALRFYGLMGKRAGGLSSSQHLVLKGVKRPFQTKRRNKGETFAGLMGRSISGGEYLNRIIPYATTTAIDVLEEPHEQGSSEEWVQILY